MNILQVFNRYLERGGEEASVERISNSLSSRHSIFHCYFDSRQMGTLEGLDGAVAGAASMAWNTSSSARLKRQVRATRTEALLLHNLFPVGTASLLHAVRQLGLPSISYIHNFRPFSVNGYLWANDRLEPAGLKKNFLPEILAGSWQGSRIRTGLYASILTGMHWFRMFDNITAWVAISDFMRDKFIEAGIPPEKIFTLRHSWDPLPACPSPRDDGHYLFLGRLITAKGVRILFDTWELVENRLGVKTPRLVIGGGGPLRAEVEEKAAQSRFIRYAGEVEGIEKSQLLQGCRAMIAPSLWWEGLGLVTYEAYDHGKPMLAASSGGLTETVKHGETGLLHTPGDAGELAEQILQLERDANLRLCLGQNGRDWLLKNTSDSQWLDNFDRILAFASQKRGHPPFSE